MIFAAILAGGKGTRIGTNIPKQFLNLNGRPIILQTIDVFLKSNLCDIIYISVNESWYDHTERLLALNYSDNERNKMKIVCGGKERIMSFLNVIYDIKKDKTVYENYISTQKILEIINFRKKMNKKNLMIKLKEEMQF